MLNEENQNADTDYGHDVTNIPPELLPRVVDYNQKFYKKFRVSRNVPVPNVELDNFVSRCKILSSQERSSNQELESVFYDFITVREEPLNNGQLLVSKPKGPNNYFWNLEKQAIESGEKYDESLWEFELETKRNLYLFDNRKRINSLEVALKKINDDNPIVENGCRLMIIRTTLNDYYTPYSSTHKYEIFPQIEDMKFIDLIKN